MKFRLLLTALLFIAFYAPAQQLPAWVQEMKKPDPDYKLLKEEFEEFWSDKKAETEPGERNFEEDEFAIQEEYGYLRYYIRQYRELIQVQPRRNPNYHPQLSKTTASVPQLGQWIEAGPFDSIAYMATVGIPWGVGRVNHIAFSGTHANVMYAVGPAGLFTSIDTGSTWNSTGTDFMGFHQFRTVTPDPYNDSIIYVGCGDFYSTNPFDAGVIKSTDFGATFTSLSNGMDTTLIQVIVIDANNTNHIVAGGYLGIWTSQDAGASWAKTYTLPTTNMVYDIKFKPGNSDTLYATTANEFLMSTDGGNTWNPGFSNFQFTYANQEQLLLGVTPSAPDYVYIATQQDFGNIYRSTDGGNTFTAMKLYTAPGLTGYDTNLLSYGQGAYDFTFSADPVNPDKVYIGSISTYESNDGGASWYTPNMYWSTQSNATRLHCDQHFIARNPVLPDRLWAANDGGVYMKMDTSDVYVPRMKNLCVTQAYHFDADNFYDSTFAVGTQDNGAYFTMDGENFYHYMGGDVFGRIYCAYNNNAAIYTWGTNMSAGTHVIDIHDGSTTYPFNIPETSASEPMSMTPFTPLTAFSGVTDVWETNDMNGNPVIWRKIFDNPLTSEFVSMSHSLADSNIFYAVRADGYLFRTFNALVNQPTFDSVALPPTAGYSPVICTVPNDPNVIYLCAGLVYKSVDQGQSWTDITGVMNPIYGFQEIVADPFANDGSVYVVATNKVYYRNDTTSWIDYSLQLPDVSYIIDITIKKFNSQVRKVMVSILNRSIWQSPVMQQLGTGIAEAPIQLPEINIYPNPAKEFVQVEIASPGITINKILIYDGRGRQIAATGKIQKTEVRIPVEKYAPGFYILEIVTSQGSVMKKIAINR